MSDAAVVEPLQQPTTTPTESEAQEAAVLAKPPASDDRSEYDSAGSYSEEEGECSESEGSVIREREEGDGQESAPSRKVDDDEDKKNPQYIPKRGTFYEHDDRTAEDEEAAAAAEAEAAENDGRKKVWQDKKERWSHDKFNDLEQAPKSRNELIENYGYDIRSEDEPPKARRRRRYGRGPNKYTRNWEDEDAYNRPQNVRPKIVKPRRSAEEFPPLGGGGNQRNIDNRNRRNGNQSNQSDGRGSSERIVEESNGNNSARAESPEARREETPQRQQQQQQQQMQHPREREQQQQQQQQQEGTTFNKNQQRVGSGRMINNQKKEIKDSDYKGYTSRSSRMMRNTRLEATKPMMRNSQQQQQQQPPPRRDDYIHSQNFTRNAPSNVSDLEKDMSKLNVQEGNKGANNRQGSVPPRLQGDQKPPPKRYSSIRQRSLPESATPPNYPPATYYANAEYGQGGGPPVTAAGPPIMQPQFQPPPPFGGAPPPPFLQPGVAPAQFIGGPHAGPPPLNYVPGFQGYQQPFTPVTPPTELFQPQGGITYYSADQQVQAQRPAPQKRPKAAIPIVAPPDSDPKARSKDGEGGGSGNLDSGAETPEASSVGSEDKSVPE